MLSPITTSCGQVFLGPIALHPESVDGLLDIFEHEHTLALREPADREAARFARQRFLDLADAKREAAAYRAPPTAEIVPWPTRRITAPAPLNVIAWRGLAAWSNTGDPS